MSARKIRCVDVSNQSLVAQLALDLPAPVLNIIAARVVQSPHTTYAIEADNAAAAAQLALPLYITNPGFARMCLVHPQWHLALQDYVKLHMQKHINQLRRSYEMMMGLNSFMLLRGAYLLKKAVVPSAQIERFDPGQYGQYASKRKTQRESNKRPVKRWPRNRKIGNPVLPKAQKNLVLAYGRAMYIGNTAASCLLAFQPQPETETGLELDAPALDE